MGNRSCKNDSVSGEGSSLRLGVRLRPKPSFMRLKIRRLLKSFFLPVAELKNRSRSNPKNND